MKRAQLPTFWNNVSLAVRLHMFFCWLKMHLLKGYILNALLVLPTIASPTYSRVVHEKRNGGSSSWTRSERLASEQVLPLRFALKQSNLDKGHDWLMDVSHPSSPNYGKHWTFEQVKNAFKPR